jgi:hypothetical protein
MSGIANNLETLKTFFSSNMEVKRRLDYIENYNYDPLATVQLERHTLPRLNPLHPSHYTDQLYQNSFAPIYSGIQSIRDYLKNPTSSDGQTVHNNAHFNPNVFFSDIQYKPANPLDGNSEHLFHFKMIYHTGLTHIGTCWVDFYVGHHNPTTSGNLYFWYEVKSFENPDQVLSSSVRIPFQIQTLQEHFNVLVILMQRASNPAPTMSGVAKRQGSGHDNSERPHAMYRTSSKFLYYY